MPNTQADLVATVLADNDLSADTRALRASEDRVWYIDRHVLYEGSGITPVELRVEACAAAVELARAWLDRRRDLQAADMLISVPYALIDDLWIDGAPNSPPPHVIICLARDEQSFKPASYNVVAKPQDSSGHPMVDSLLHAGVLLKRLESDPDAPEEGGCWVLEVS